MAFGATSGGAQKPPTQTKPAAKGKFASPEEAMMAIEEARRSGDPAALDKVMKEACTQFPDLAICRQRRDNAMNSALRQGFGRGPAQQPPQ